MKIKDIGEIGLIKRLTDGIKLDRSVVKGVGDDAAVIKWTAGKYLLYTCDMLVEDVHFRRSSARPFQIGWKSLGRNISDIAAMGGVPRYAVVSIALPPSLEVSFADGIYKGIKALARKCGVNIVGGDVSRSEKIIVDVSLIGEVGKNDLVTRCGARKGDLVLVTGSIGGSLKGKHLDFQPRLEESRAMVKRYGLSSMIDVTDGLLLDLWRILDQSRVGARIYRNMIPLSPDAGPFDTAVREGEDFELLFTMSVKEARRFFKRDLLKMKTPVTLIGEIMDKSYGYRLIREGGKAEKLSARSGGKGYLHF
jgi:thiamine-monophosphate kinase